ncbi:MAG: methylase [Lactobacillus crispatus]|nr:methylase [Lactobacillus crispatus]
MSKVTEEEIQNFISTWSNQGREVADKQIYWDSLLEILGVPSEQIKNKSYIEYEKPVILHKNDNFRGYIDAYIKPTKVLIEQKSNGVDLFKAEDRPNGGDTKKLTPFNQANRYNSRLGKNEKADYFVLCNFSQIVIYDIRKSMDVEPYIINIKDLKNELHNLSFLVKSDEDIRLEKEKDISVVAGELVGKIYNEFTKIFAKYNAVEDEKVKHSINILCVRIVFCLYAEDAGLFEKGQFYDYLEKVEPNKCGEALTQLFKVLDTKLENRAKKFPYLQEAHPKLSAFTYVNGGLFKDENIIVPPFTQKLKDIILNEASRGFNWEGISPTIFGAVFESTLNPETRRQSGMHYTSVENILKVIKPLFLDNLKNELKSIKNRKQFNVRKKKAREFQEKLSKLKIFDPACGSGNFLTQTYLELRKLENEAIKLQNQRIYTKNKGAQFSQFQSENYTDNVSNQNAGVNSVFDTNIIKVSIQQFYGLEINDFAVSVAKTAMWIAESKMWKKTKELVLNNSDISDFLPLHPYTNIHEADALETDWNTVLPNSQCNYIIGNPPFVGPKKLTSEQKEDRAVVFKDVKRAGMLDFVACWYAKATEYMQGTHIQTAFVSTNSIVQGTQVPVLWDFLLNKGVQINFAYRTFPWESEAKSKAEVFCVIIGFTTFKLNKPKYIFEENQKFQVKNISPYLTDSDNIFITLRNKPVSKVSNIMMGTTLLDKGNYVFTYNEMEQFLKKEPQARSLFCKYYSGRDFLNSEPRYVLWLANANPSELRHMKFVMKRIKAVKEFRSSSGRDAQRFKNEPLRPAWFNYYSSEHKQKALVIPVVSATRDYIPIGIVDKNTICGQKLWLMEFQNPYIFGVLESKIHTAWAKTICNRLGNGISYSSSIVYNNFPFPNTTDEQKEKIEQTAQAILDARANHPNDSLADLYDPRGLMPSDLRKAHQANDKAVLKAYGLSTKATESEIVAHLFKMYEKLTKNEK